MKSKKKNYENRTKSKSQMTGKTTYFDFADGIESGVGRRRLHIPFGLDNISSQ